MLVIAHHGIEPLLPAALGVSALFVHYVRAWVRLNGRRFRRRRSVGLDDGTP